MAGNLKSSEDGVSSDDFLDEIERHVHLACVLLIQSGSKGIQVFEGKRNEGQMIWGKTQEGRSRLKSLLARFVESGSATVLLRCFTRSLDSKTNARLKNIFGWQIKNSANRLVAEPIEIEQLRNLCSKDPITGESVAVGSDLVFRTGRAISK